MYRNKFLHILFRIKIDFCIVRIKIVRIKNISSAVLRDKI